MSYSGTELRDNNEKIVYLMSLLREQRDEMCYLVEKQIEEKSCIQNEIEKLTFKLSLLNKSLTQRLQAKVNYDKTIKDIEEHYLGLVQDSGKLLCSLTHGVQELEEIMDKKTDTGGSLKEKTDSKDAEPDKKNAETDSEPISEKSSQSNKPNSRRASEEPKKPFPPPIKPQNNSEIQSYREAYERQHSQSDTPERSSRRNTPTK